MRKVKIKYQRIKKQKLDDEDVSPDEELLGSDEQNSTSVTNGMAITWLIWLSQTSTNLTNLMKTVILYII